MVSSELQEPQQGTQEWLMDRLGKVTASRIADVVGKTKTGSYLAARDTYKWQLVRERVTGVPTEFRVTAPMQFGLDNEADARIFYETLYGVSVEQMGFADHPTVAMSGASPDGLVGEEGLIEIKCLETTNHLRAIYSAITPQYYVNQCMWQMAVLGRQWCDLTLYDPRVPEEMQLRRFRIVRDEAAIADLELEVLKFNNEIDEILTKLWSNDHV